jgi:tRNA A-37 threonylcarbamoyl transferase component Bud32
MAHLPTSSEINDEDDCQLVSFTNKLPYYVRHLCKSTNKIKTAAAVTSIPKDHNISSEVDSIHLNETHQQSVAVFSLSSSSSSSSLNEPIRTSSLMSTRILPVGYYHDQDQTTSTNINGKTSTSSSLLKCLNTYCEQIPFPSSCSSSSSSTSSNSSSSSSTNPSTKKDSLPGHSLETLTIEQNLFNMVRFDIIKSNFCDYYQLGNFVRSGGFSDIHEGIRLSDNKQVVVKFIPKEKTKNWLMISQKRYPAEILLHKAVHEIQGVIHVYDYFETADHWILVMERLHNCQDLFDYLESRERGRLNEVTARKFFQQLILINLAMLRKGVVHRDLKSENILVDLNTESLILIDFGASAIYKSSSSYYSDFHGTKQYKSPEYIIRKRYAGVPSTVWTLGVLLYDMVCGSLPFENEEEITGHKIVLKSHLSAELKNLIQRCLAQNPDRRPSLESILEHAWFKN